MVFPLFYQNLLCLIPYFLRQNYILRDLKVRRNEVSRYTDGNMILLRNNCEWERITSAYAVNIIKSELEFDNNYLMQSIYLYMLTAYYHCPSIYHSI